MTYPDDMDKECVRLCNAMNSFGGVLTTGSCSGHEKGVMQIHFNVSGNHDKNLPPLLYYFDHCHTGIAGWMVRVYTDCAADRAAFVVTSTSVGKEAYEEANRIAGYMERFLSIKNETPS